MIAFWVACGVVALVALFVWALGRSAARRNHSFVRYGIESTWGTAPVTSAAHLTLLTPPATGQLSGEMGQPQAPETAAGVKLNLVPWVPGRDVNAADYIPVRQAAGVAMYLAARNRAAQDIVIPPGEYTRKQFADEIERLLPGARVTISDFHGSDSHRRLHPFLSTGSDL